MGNTLELDIVKPTSFNMFWGNLGFCLLLRKELPSFPVHYIDPKKNVQFRMFSYIYILYIICISVMS